MDISREKRSTQDVWQKQLFLSLCIMDLIRKLVPLAVYEYLPLTYVSILLTEPQ